VYRVKIYLILQQCMDAQGAGVMSAHATRELAEAELKLWNDSDHAVWLSYEIEEIELQGT
jgi:hypothetical protein